MKLQSRVIGPNDRDLLEIAVHEALYPNWPHVKPGPKVDTEDHVTADTILKGVGKKSPHVREFAIVVGENLDHPERRRIAGISNGLYFPQTGTALMLYVFPTDYARGSEAVEEKIMKETYKAIGDIAKASKRPINAVFVELLDPQRAETRTERYNAERELDHYIGENGKIHAAEAGGVMGLGHALSYANPHWGSDLQLYSIPDNHGQYARPQDVCGLVDDLHKHGYTKSIQMKPGYQALKDTMMGQIAQAEAKFEPGDHVLRKGPANEGLA
jgi:hypothetical protein